MLLGWQEEDVAEKLASKATLNVRVPGRIPVHLTYFTAWPRPDGSIDTFADIYGRDQKMQDALTAVAMAQR